MVNIGLVGVGYWGPNLARTFHDLPGAKLLKIADRDAKALEKMSKLYPDAEMTREGSSVLNDSKIDAVVLAVPPSLHFEFGKQALDAGKHLFVEKPLTLTAEDAERLVKLAQERQRVLMVGHLLKYHPAVKKLKDLVTTGTLGEIRYIYSRRLNLGKIRREENALWNFAPHDISVILYLLDKLPVEVSAVGASYLQKGIEDVSFINLVFPDEVMANLHVSWLDPHRRREFTIVGSKKMALFNDVSTMEKIRVYDKGVSSVKTYESFGESLSIRMGDIWSPWVETTEPLKLECQHFIDCIVQGKQPLSDGMDGLHVVRILRAAQVSMERRGQPIKIDG
jgi:predicted dehydrogenase